jgi:hypothetical protein
VVVVGSSLGFLPPLLLLTFSGTLYNPAPTRKTKSENETKRKEK